MPSDKGAKDQMFLGYLITVPYIERQIWACPVSLLKNLESFGLLFLGQVSYF